jgi:hypothetical protein
MYKVNIVIPIHNEVLEGDELKSLTQCFSVLKNHTITLACNQRLNCKAYEQLGEMYGNRPKIERFDDKYFQSANGYNTLLTEHLFYSRFSEHDYILIYQSDCYIFRDDLEEWCSKGFDYIGAPWINTPWLKQTRQELMKQSLQSKSLLKGFTTKLSWFLKGYYRKDSLNVGNGGLALRKISSCLHISAQTQFVKSWQGNHEDGFWSIYVPLNFNFKLPDYKEAAAFSFDCDPEVAFEINNRKIPTACHAWCRKDHPYEGNIAFWQKIIQ